MSNHLAIAAVTYTLAEQIQPVLQAVVPSARVRFGRPEATERSSTAFVGANLYLYHLEPNAALRNSDLATRGPDGALLRRPQVALDLYYLLSFYGNDLQLESQRMLGGVVALLHAQPVLTREHIRQAVAQNRATATPYLGEADLDQQVDLVRLKPVSYSLEELSKLWSVFFQTTHTVSLAYQAGVVLIEADVPVHQALPVRSLRTLTQPTLPPLIRQILPSLIDPDEGAVLLLQGDGLDGPDFQARFGERAYPAQPAPGGLAVALPPDLPAGLNQIQLVRRLPEGGTQESNPATFVLRPAIDGDPAVAWISDPRSPLGEQIATLALALRPDIAPDQRPLLLLNELGATATARAYSLDTALRFSIDARAATGLDSGQPSPELRTACRSAGLELPAGASAQVLRAGQLWRIDGPDGLSLRLVRWGQRLSVCYGLPTDATLAFQLRGVAPGRYLARVQIAQVQYAESRLQVGPDGAYNGPIVTISEETP